MRQRPIIRKMLCTAALAVLPLTSSAAGGVYKWTDGSGATHYDDRSVQGQLITRDYINQRQIKATPDWLGVVPADFVADVSLRCSQLSGRLQDYRGASQLFGRDPDGNVYALSASQAGLLIAETRRDAARYCRPNAAQLLYAERQKDARR